MYISCYHKFQLSRERDTRRIANVDARGEKHAAGAALACSLVINGPVDV